MAVVILVIAAVLLLATFPVALFAVAHWMAAETSLSLAASLGIVSGGGLLIALGMAAWAFRRLRRSFNVLERSREEFVQNLQWVQAALKSQGATGKTQPAEDPTRRF